MLSWPWVYILVWLVQTVAEIIESISKCFEFIQYKTTSPLFSFSYLQNNNPV